MSSLDLVVIARADILAEVGKKLAEEFPGKNFSVYRAGDTDETSVSRIVTSCPVCNNSVHIPVELDMFNETTRAT